MIEVPFVTSGIRVGTPAITTRGLLKASDMAAVVGFIDEAIQHAENDEALHEIGDRVSAYDVSQKIVCDVKNDSAITFLPTFSIENSVVGEM